MRRSKRIELDTTRKCLYVPIYCDQRRRSESKNSGVVYDDRCIVWSAASKAQRWQAQRPDTEAFHAFRSHLNSSYQEQYSTEQVAPNRSSHTTTYSINTPTSIHLFFAFALFSSLSPMKRAHSGSFNYVYAAIAC